MSLGRLCTVLLIVTAVGLSACGRRGALEPAPTPTVEESPGTIVQQEPEEDNPFILDVLID